MIHNECNKLSTGGGGGGGGGHNNFVCTGVCSHRIGQLTHLQTKAGPSINKNRPIPKLFTIEHEPKLTELLWVLLNLEESHPFPGKIIEMMTSSEVLRIRIMTHPQVFGQKFTPIRRFLASKTRPF